MLSVMRAVIAFGAAVALTAVVPPSLSPATLKAYDHYVSLTEQRITAERDGKAALLWIDRQPERERARALERLTRGETVVAEMETREAGKEIRIKDGIVHHWVATVLLPGVKIDRAMAFVGDYANYSKAFAPLVTRASISSRSEGRDVVAMRTSVRKVITVTMDGDYVIDYRRISPSRFVSTMVATNLHQVSDEGLKTERREPADQTAGYLWRYRMYCAIEERAEGTLNQCESITLTRDVPALVSWVVGPFVTGIPRDSLSLMVTAARRALLK
jgi:hypothetical protein